MTDWNEHNCGPQPVADSVWVGIVTPPCLNWWDIETAPAKEVGWGQKFEWSILNQHLIDVARLEGIRLGLEAAHKAICALPVTPESDPERVQDDCADSIAYDLMINIDTIAREAVLDQLTSEAQADNMGYDND